MSRSHPVVPFVLSALLWASFPILNMYLPVHLRGLGLSLTEIGWLVALLPLFAIVVPPLVGQLADRSPSKNAVLIGLTLGSVAAAAIYLVVGDFAGLLVAGLVMALFQSAQGPLCEAILLETLEGTGRSYGPVRLVGTVSFAVVALGAGVLVHLDSRWLFVVAGTLGLVSVGALLWLPTVKGHGGRGPRVPARNLFRDRLLVRMLALALAASAGIGFYGNYFGLYFLDLGGRKDEIGALLFLMAIAEVPFLWRADRWIEVWGRRRALLGASAVVVGRFVVLALIGAPVWLYPISLLNGFTFIIFSYGIATHISRSVAPELKATGQAVLGAAMSMGRVLGAVVGGWCAGAWGLRITFWGLAAVEALAGIGFWWATRPSKETT